MLHKNMRVLIFARLPLICKNLDLVQKPGIISQCVGISKKPLECIVIHLLSLLIQI